MKVFLVVCLIGILVLERPRGFGDTIKIQAGVLARDLKRNLLVVVLALFAITFLVDASLLRTIQSVQAPVGKSLIKFGGSVGNNGNFWFAMILLYGVTKVVRSKRATHIVLLTMLSAGLTGLICNIVKVLFLRSRPAAGVGESSFFNILGYLQHEGLYLSMPSGDVALVAGAAAFLFHFAPNRGVRALLVAVPLLTCASRIYLNRHWPSDTVLAVAIGVLVGTYLYRAYVMRVTNYTQLPLSLRIHRPLLELPESDERR